LGKCGQLCEPRFDVRGTRVVLVYHLLELLKEINAGAQRTAGYSCSSGNDVPKGMQQYFDAAMGKPGIEDILLTMRSDVEAYYGRLGKAREFSRSPQE